MTTIFLFLLAEIEAAGPGVDPNALVAHLEGIPQGPSAPGASPGTSPSSSQQDMYLTPSMSTPGSSEPTDPPSPTIEMPPPPPQPAPDEKVGWIDSGSYLCIFWIFMFFGSHDTVCEYLMHSMPQWESCTRTVVWFQYSGKNFQQLSYQCMLCLGSRYCNCTYAELVGK